MMLVLEDLKGMTEFQVKKHLELGYTGEGINISEVAALLEDMDILIAYESVGSWGCDSSSFFLLKDREGKLYEVHGSHCSCYGFEGQFRLEETNVEALKARAHGTRYGLFSIGGYDENSDYNIAEAKQYIIDNL
ncbi:hypothetical protein UFOVP449_201 [uncultured Caudovirales phage]|uniref:Uncharacterized protein n=1 Tax=uncultured Caudovirales phage TaxID=2100421 RepID=A0A6J5MIM7_9CAUD|nr:hypothetical protein UFOVP449_201 [uncultured Caudovirales phage]